MEQATAENFAELTSKGITCVIFTKDGCSNCVKVKPVIEQVAASRKSVKFYEYRCVAPDEVTNRFRINLFPKVVFMHDGEDFFSTEGLVSDRELNVPFSDVTIMKSTAFDMISLIEQARAAEPQLKALNRLIAARSRFSIEEPVHEPEVKAAEIPAKPIVRAAIPDAPSGDPLEGGCDSCQ